MFASSITKNRILLFPTDSNKKMKMNHGWTQMNQINYSITIYYLRSTVLICGSKKIPGGIKTVGNLCFQLKKPLFDRNQGYTEPEIEVFVVQDVVVPVRRTTALREVEHAAAAHNDVQVHTEETHGICYG